MKILVVGSGAREHAILSKLSVSPVVNALFVWPGNTAMEGLASRLELPSGSSWENVIKKAHELSIDGVVCGPEQPLSEGIADLAARYGMPLFGPTMRAAQLEASKVFAKDVMRAAAIPTADFVVVDSFDACQHEAQTFLGNKGAVVLKASGLAAGKGVFVCKDKVSLHEALHHLYETDMKEAAQQVVIEEMLVGREVSFFCFIGQDGVTPLGFAVDFKRLNEDDAGPNTGGMGCYTPVPWLPTEAEEVVLKKVVTPLLTELASRNIKYTGCLYVGLMWGANGPKVIEFNVRLGDPEAQVLAAYDRKDWGIMIARHLGLAIAEDMSSAHNTPPPEGAAVAVVVASKGYPFDTCTDMPETLPRAYFQMNDDATSVFGASVQPLSASSIQTGKGRIFTVTAYAPSFRQARKLVYETIDKIVGKSDRLRYRIDIAAKIAEEYEG